MQNVITRDFINPNFKLQGDNSLISKSQLVDMIRYWKILLWEKYQLRKGSKVGIACLEVDAYHISLIFACSELGCQFVSLDHPISQATINKTKAAMFSPIDLGIVDDILVKDGLHQKMLETYCKQVAPLSVFDSYNIADHGLFLTVADFYFCQEDDVLFLASTSGTTSESTRVPYTHKYTAQLSVRNSVIFNHKNHSRVIHTRNMHHASSLLLHFLPTLYACSNHWHKYFNSNDHESMDKFIDMLINFQINFCLLDNRFNLDSIIKKLKYRKICFDHSIEFNISGFLLDRQLQDNIADHNITVVSTFGSVDTGVPLFINRLTRDTDPFSLTDGLIGYFPDDDFYRLTISEGSVQVDCPGHWHARTLNDCIKEKNNVYYHLHRSNTITFENLSFDLVSLTGFVQQLLNNTDLSVVVDLKNQSLYLVIWNNFVTIELHALKQALIDSKFKNCASFFKKIKNLNKKQFTIDTKVSVDQLRGYLQANDTN